MNFYRCNMNIWTQNINCELIVKYLTVSLEFYIVAPRRSPLRIPSYSGDTSVNSQEFMRPADKCFITRYISTSGALDPQIFLQKLVLAHIFLERIHAVIR